LETFLTTDMTIFLKAKTLLRKPSIVITKAIGYIRHLKYPAIDASAIIVKPLKFTSRFIALGKNVFIYNNARIEAVCQYAGISYNPQITIGQGTSIQQNNHITCANSVTIGSNCAITHNVTITDIDHPYEYEPSNYPPPIGNQLITSTVSIGDNCMIFANSVILGSSQIGNNCIIAANSVVRGKYPDNCVIAGTPAKVVKRYNPVSQRWEKTNPNGTFIEK